ncbi:MAG: DUF2076 domain-containing protein [Caulobacteraceae bacterium]|nr:DUF2076 domain-containing protein [Caulobacter sp.]
MTPQERDLLSRFLDDLGRAQSGPKDAEAAGQIDQALRANPDAGYVLVQHAIVADAALHDAQARVAELERQLQDGQGGPPAVTQEQPSFLGALFGRARPNEQSGVQAGTSGPWQAPASAVPPTGAPPPGYGGYGGGAPGPFSGGGGLGSFLRGAGTTAAGVAGGAFLFEGLNDLFGGGRRREGFADMGGGDYGGGQGFADDGGGFDIDPGADSYS